MRGVEQMIAVFQGGFDETREMRFEVTEVARRGLRGFIAWRMHFRPRRFGGETAWRVDRVSEVHLTAEGKIGAHLD